MVATPRVGPNRDVSSEFANARVVYVLYLVGASFIGLVFAYVNDSKLKNLGPADGGRWLRSHFRFQIRTFWIQALYLGASIAASSVIFGRDNKVVPVILGVLVLIWVIVRCAKGMMYLSKRQEHPNPITWLFG